jgi:hypothetical protein
MSALSTYLENALLDHVLRNTALASPATVYLGLFLTDPTDADVGTEVSGGSYARQSIAFDAAAAGITQNSALVTFPTATADWGVVSHIGLYDAVSGGNLLYHAELNTAEQVLDTETFSVAAGALTVAME